MRSRMELACWVSLRVEREDTYLTRCGSRGLAREVSRDTLWAVCFSFEARVGTLAFGTCWQRVEALCLEVEALCLEVEALSPRPRALARPLQNPPPCTHRGRCDSVLADEVPAPPTAPENGDETLRI